MNQRFDLPSTFLANCGSVGYLDQHSHHQTARGGEPMTGKNKQSVEVTEEREREKKNGDATSLSRLLSVRQ